MSLNPKGRVSIDLLLMVLCASVHAMYQVMH